MIKRIRYGKEFRDSIRNEITSGQSTIAQISKREKIASQKLRNWMKESSVCINGSEQTEITSLKRQNEQLALALGEMAFEIHILKKFQKYQEQKQKLENSSGTLSPQKSVSLKDAKS
jgi:transposase-like protein